MIVEESRAEREYEAKADAEQLTLQVIRSVTLLGQSLNRGGREDHNEAEARQRDDCRDEYEPRLHDRGGHAHDLALYV